MSAQVSNDVVPTGVDHIVPLDVENYDTDSMHDPAFNERITFNTDGIYVVTANVRVPTPADALPQTARLRARDLVGPTTIKQIQFALLATDANETLAFQHLFTAGDVMFFTILHADSGDLSCDLQVEVTWLRPAP